MNFFYANPYLILLWLSSSMCCLHWESDILSVMCIDCCHQVLLPLLCPPFVQPSPHHGFCGFWWQSCLPIVLPGAHVITEYILYISQLGCVDNEGNIVAHWDWHTSAYMLLAELGPKDSHCCILIWKQPLVGADARKTGNALSPL